MTLSELAEKPGTGCEGTARGLVRVNEGAISLKTVFDHITNYAVCAGVLAVAAHLAKTGELLGKVTATVLLLLFLVLLALNIMQGLVLASAMGMRRWAGFALGALMVLVFAQLAIAPAFWLR